MKGFIYVIDTGERIVFEEGGKLYDIAPQETKSAEYSPVELPGRYEPLMVYQGSSEKEVSFQLRLYSSDPTKVEETVDRLRSLVYPTYKNGLFFPPPKIVFVWGKTIKFRGVVTSFEVSYEGSIYDMQKGLSYTAQVSISMIEQRNRPAHHKLVWEGKA